MPAILVFLGVLGAGLLVFAATGQFRSARTDQPLEALERQIVGSTDGRLWCTYGDRLAQSRQFASAAKAYARAAALAPDLPDVRLKQGLALGQSGDAAAFFDYVSRLATMYPKLAADLMDRQELLALHADPHWASTQATVRAQAMD